MGLSVAPSSDSPGSSWHAMTHVWLTPRAALKSSVWVWGTWPRLLPVPLAQGPAARGLMCLTVIWSDLDIRCCLSTV